MEEVSMSGVIHNATVCMLNQPLQHCQTGHSVRNLRDISLQDFRDLRDFPTLISHDCIKDMCILLHDDIVNCITLSSEIPNKWKEAQGHSNTKMSQS